MDTKLLIRVLLKVPVTFVFIPFMVLALIICYLLRLFDYIYEKDDVNIITDKEIIKDIKVSIKKWFITL